MTGEEIKQFLRTRIANYKVPKTIDIEAVLPTLPNGKLDKMALKARV